MKISFFILLTIFLTIIQTTVLPDFFLSIYFFDLMIITVLYLSLSFTHPGMIAAVILMGCIVDSVSGVYFGLYLTAYLWLYVIVQVLKQFVFASNIVFYVIISAVAVMIESLLLVLSVFINQGEAGLLTLNYSCMVIQLLLACFFIPVILEILTFMQKKYEMIISGIMGSINKSQENYK